jgi:hypothetical protein
MLLYQEGSNSCIVIILYLLVGVIYNYFLLIIMRNIKI